MDNKRLVINPKKNLQNLKEIGEIQEASRKIVRAKELAYKAKNIENSFFETLNPFAKSETDKKLEALSEADIANAEAIGAQNELIQETIKLICCDMVFADLMINELSLMIYEKYEINEEAILSLSNDTKKLVKKLQQRFFIKQNNALLKCKRQNKKYKKPKKILEIWKMI